MLPVMDSLTPINSSAIRVIWRPSPSIQHIDLTQLEGIFTVALYAGTKVYSPKFSIIASVTDLNNTYEIIVAHLIPDTVYNVCFHTKWHEEFATIIEFDFDGLQRRGCQLLRTYMNDQTTLNPVPPFGGYTWKQIATNGGKTAIVVNASILYELPYNTRNITVTLGSNSESRTFKTPTTFVEFQFDGLDSQPKDYPLSITFMLVDNTVDKRFTITNTIKETVKTTLAHNMGMKLFLCHSMFLIILTTFFL